MTSSMVQGPYSSWEQELWYRYYSLGFLIAGVVLPAMAMLLGAARSPKTVGILIIWMTVALMGFSFYAMMWGAV